MNMSSSRKREFGLFKIAKVINGSISFLSAGIIVLMALIPLANAQSDSADFCMDPFGRDQYLNWHDYKDQSEYERKARCYWREGGLEQLGALLHVGLERYPNSAILWDMQAAYHYEYRNNSECMNAMSKALSLEPKDYRYYNMGFYEYDLAKDYQSALGHFRKGETIANERPLVYFYIAKCCEETGDLKSAADYYHKYLAEDPNGKYASEVIENLKRLQPTPTAAPSPPRLPPDGGVPPGPVDPPLSSCCFHIWATGCNLGWATSLIKAGCVRTRWEPADGTPYVQLYVAGRHLRDAYHACSKMNPAWPDWRSKKAFLEKQANRLWQHPDPKTRLQIFKALDGLHHWADSLKGQVVYRGRPETFAHKATCAEKYFLLGLYLSRAQQSMKIAQEGRRNNRGDWQKHITDGQHFLSKALAVLERYYLVQTGGCVEIKELEPQARIVKIKNPQGMSNQLNGRVRELDTLIAQLQRRIENRCLAGQPGGHDDGGCGPVEDQGRLVFEVANVGFNPWVRGGEVTVDLKITLRRGGGPVTLGMPRKFMFAEQINRTVVKNGEQLSLDVLGVNRLFVEVEYGRKWLQIFRDGREERSIQFTLQPGESVILKIFAFMDIYNPWDWDNALVFKFEYNEEGKRVSQRTPIFSPGCYWDSFKEMSARVPPRIRR